MSLFRRGTTAAGAAAVYAATDEIHQLFVPGRAGRFSDVCIDGAGAVLGVVVFVVIVKLVLAIRGLKEKREECRLRKIEVQAEPVEQAPQAEEAQEE